MSLLLVAPEFITFILGLLVVSLVISLVLSVIYRKEIRKIVFSRFFRSLVTNLITICLMIGILGMINYLVVKNDYFVDFTRNKLHSLSVQSVNAVKLLGEKEMHMKLFAKRENWGRYLNLLNLYRNIGKNIKVKFYDVDKEVALNSLYGIKEEGTLIIEYDKKRFKTKAENELAVTNLLLRILTPDKKIIYYSVGHNEMSLNDKNGVGGDFLKEKILNSNYILKSLELQNGIPADAAGILILNPQIEFLDIEIKNLKRYIIKGGGILTTLSPRFNGLLIKKYVSFLSQLGVEFHNVLILDRLASQQGSQPSIPVVNSYDTKHKITEKLTDRTLFPVSGALTIKDHKLFDWSELAKSTPFPGSWGEVNFEEVKTGKAKYNVTRDIQGPLSIFVAGENQRSRVLVYASSSFIANQFQGQSTNFNLFLNSLSWMVREESLMSLNRPELDGDLVYISDIQLNLIFYFSILVFPFLFFGIGIWTYRRKISG